MGGGTHVGALMFSTCIYIGSSDGLGSKSFEFRFFLGGGDGGRGVGIRKNECFCGCSFLGSTH